MYKNTGTTWHIDKTRQNAAKFGTFAHNKSIRTIRNTTTFCTSRQLQSVTQIFTIKKVKVYTINTINFRILMDRQTTNNRCNRIVRAIRTNKS